MFHDTTFPPPDPRLAQFARMIDAFERDDIERAVDLLIERLDAADGDADLEDSDDDTAVDDGGCDHDADRESGGWAEGAQGAANTIPDDDCEEQLDEVRHRRAHRDYIRLSACDRITRWGVTEYSLRSEMPRIKAPAGFEARLPGGSVSHV